MNAKPKQAGKSMISEADPNSATVCQAARPDWFRPLPTPYGLPPTAFCLLSSTLYLRSFLVRLCLRTAAFCLLFLLPACGYRVAGRGDRLPPDIKTIAVPIFVNQTPRFRIEQALAAAVTREFIERTKFRITPNPARADAVLRGTVKDVRSGVITFDLNTGRATSMQVQVIAEVKLEDLHSHRVVFANSNYVFREQYQVSQTTSGLFEEDQPALERLSRDLARTLVTEILENF